MLRLLTLLILCTCCGCQSTGGWQHNSTRQTTLRRAEKTSVVYVTGNGFHTGLVLRTADIPRDVWPEIDRLPDHPWIEVGWGSEIFYRATAITPGVVVGAVFPNPSVLHLVGWDRPPELVFPGDLVRLVVDENDLIELCHYIHNSYEPDDNGRPQYLGNGIYGDSSFFRARGKYYFPNTCNVWTAKALREAGVAASPRISILADPVVRAAQRAGTTVRRR